MAVAPGSGLSGYSSGAGAAAAYGGGAATPDLNRFGEGASYWTLAQCKRAYTDYLDNKRAEIDEQQDARRYRHGVQWTSAQIKVFNDRKQPVITFNRLGRKIDGIIGLTENLRREPKAFPRSPRFQASADLATAALRAALEKAKWKPKSRYCAETAAVDGIGGVELVLKQNRNGTYDIDVEEVDTAGYFYDPRSKKEDFSDATYQGLGKWVDADVLIDMMPQHEEKIRNAIGHGNELTSNSDSDNPWFMASGDRKSVRLVYICYRHRGGWCWALFTGSDKLMEGQSYFVNGDGDTVCSFLMFSAAIDQDNDRYGFPRNLKGPQDEINQRRSKGLHELNTRRIVGEVGAFDDIEKARKEAVRPDGVVLRNKGFEAEFDDAKKAQDIAGQLKFLEDARGEVENFGPNPALLGNQGISNRSGRAISLMQQAGLAELGPYISAHGNWKLRVYETMFYAIKKYWTDERWIRVTDDGGEEQFVQINAMQLGPMGMPQIVNSLGELDVEIVLDEGPDTVTQMQDMYEALAQIVPAIGQLLTPPEVQALVQMLVETSPLPAMAKKKFRQAAEMAKQPNPLAQAMQQLQVEGAKAQVEETQSKTVLNYAKAQSEGVPDVGPMQSEFQLPPEVQVEAAYADIDKTRADAAHKMTLARREGQGAQIETLDYAQRAQQAMHDQRYDEIELLQRSSEQAHNRQYDRVDLALRKYEADAAKQAKAQRPSAS